MFVAVPDAGDVIAGAAGKAVSTVTKMDVEFEFPALSVALAVNLCKPSDNPSTVADQDVVPVATTDSVKIWTRLLLLSAT